MDDKKMWMHLLRILLTILILLLVLVFIKKVGEKAYDYGYRAVTENELFAQNSAKEEASDSQTDLQTDEEETKE